MQKKALRQKALHESTSIPEAEKIKIRQALITTDYMSSEYTVSEDSECPSPGGSDNSDAECSKGPKEFAVHKLPWRSGEANRIMGSLDKRVKKHRGTKGRSMLYNRKTGANSLRGVPEDAPAWAVRNPSCQL